MKQIAIFKPINNNPWFEIREFEIINWKATWFKCLPIQDYYSDDLKIYKPLCLCNSKLEYNNQFLDTSNQLSIL